MGLIAVKCIKDTFRGGRLYKANVEYPIRKLGELDSREKAVWVKAHFKPVYDQEGPALGPAVKEPEPEVDEQTIINIDSEPGEETSDAERD